LVDIERRTAPITLELRADGRTIAGTVVPYNVEARIGSYVERFLPGAFGDAEPAQIPFTALHDRESLPIGRALSLTDTPAGLEGELRVSETRLGDDALTLIRDGAATGLSVGFIPVEDRWNQAGTAVERIKAKLVEISLVAFPAYEDARILAVRGEREAARAEWRTHRLTLARWQD
jgi:HK97 family phage prohead protease